jgi:hypothetical protein
MAATSCGALIDGICLHDRWSCQRKVESRMLRFLKAIFIVIAAIVILFEEWLWDPLKRIMQAFSRLPPVRQLAEAISRLSPYAAAFAFLGPMLVLLPFKIIGLLLIASHHALLGLAAFLSAKIVGTALFAWLFGLTKPALMQISWFEKGYRIVHQISEKAHAWIHRQPLYRWIRTSAYKIHLRIARLLRSIR